MIGDKIKKLRIKNKLTQLDLASKLFVSDKTISSWESNRTEPDFNTILKICEILNVTPYYFMIDEKNSNIEVEVKTKVGELEYNRLLDNIKNSKYLGCEKQYATYYSNQNLFNKWLIFI